MRLLILLSLICSSCAVKYNRDYKTKWHNNILKLKENNTYFITSDYDMHFHIDSGNFIKKGHTFIINSDMQKDTFFWYFFDKSTVSGKYGVDLTYLFSSWYKDSVIDEENFYVNNIELLTLMKANPGNIVFFSSPVIYITYRSDKGTSINEYITLQKGKTLHFDPEFHDYSIPVFFKKGLFGRKINMYYKEKSDFMLHSERKYSYIRTFWITK